MFRSHFFIMVIMIVTVVIMVIMVIITVVTVVTVAATSFFSNVLDIITSRVFQVVLSSFEFIWTVCCVSSKSTHSRCINSERRNVPGTNMPFEA